MFGQEFYYVARRSSAVSTKFIATKALADGGLHSVERNRTGD